MPSCILYTWQPALPLGCWLVCLLSCFRTHGWLLTRFQLSISSGFRTRLFIPFVFFFFFFSLFNYAGNPITASNKTHLIKFYTNYEPILFP